MRSEQASSAPLERVYDSPNTADGVTGDNTLSEQCVLVLTLIDALPFLPILLLEEWLPITAETLHTIQDDTMKHKCQQRFWAVLSNGEMDVNCAALCVSWWSTSGREAVLHGRQKREDTLMSGGLGEPSKL